MSMPRKFRPSLGARLRPFADVERLESRVVPSTVNVSIGSSTASPNYIPGTAITYTLTVNNLTASSIPAGAQVADTLPDYLNFASATMNGAAYTPTASTVTVGFSTQTIETFTLPTLAANSTTTLTLTLDSPTQQPLGSTAGSVVNIGNSATLTLPNGYTNSSASTSTSITSPVGYYVILTDAPLTPQTEISAFTPDTGYTLRQLINYYDEHSNATGSVPGVPNNASSADQMIINLGGGTYQFQNAPAPPVGQGDSLYELLVNNAGNNSSTRLPLVIQNGTIAGNFQSRIFSISGAALTLQGVTITNGVEIGESYNVNTGTTTRGDAFGGGIYVDNRGVLDLEPYTSGSTTQGTVIQNCVASAPAGTNVGAGTNGTTRQGVGYNAAGGGLYGAAGSTITISSTTQITNNRAIGGKGAQVNNPSIGHGGNGGGAFGAGVAVQAPQSGSAVTTTSNYATLNLVGGAVIGNNAINQVTVSGVVKSTGGTGGGCSTGGRGGAGGVAQGAGLYIGGGQLNLSGTTSVQLSGNANFGGKGGASTNGNGAAGAVQGAVYYQPSQVNATATPTAAGFFAFSTPALPSVGNYGFESPSVPGSYAYTPSGASWTFTGGAGVSGNGSGFTALNPNAPQGTQVAFLQKGNGQLSGSNASSISQQINGLTAGQAYTVSFASAIRANYGLQTFLVTINGVSVGTFAPTSTSYASYTTSTFFAPANGSVTLAFVGLGAGGADVTDFIDNVSLAGATLSLTTLYLPTVTTAADAVVSATSAWDLRAAVAAANALATTGQAVVLNLPSATLSLGVNAPLALTSPVGSVRIQGAGPAASVVNAGASTSSIFSLNGSTVVLANFGITGAHVASGNGGAVTAQNSIVNLTSMSLKSNSVSATSGYGGGVYLSGGTLSVAKSTFSHNQAAYGGALAVNGGSVTFASSSAAKNNTATYGGGGLYVLGQSNVSLNNAAVSSNRVTLNGNASANGQGNGGGLYLGSGGKLQIKSSTVKNNRAYANGGGVAAYTGSVKLSNAAVSGNSAATATGSGGGLYQTGGTLTVVGSSVAGNSANTGGGLGLVNVATNMSPTSTVSGFSGGWSGVSNGTGPATIASNVLTLTDGQGSEARAAWYHTPVAVNTNFVVSYVYTAVSGAADGVAFVLQNSSAGTGALGGAGGGLGYSGISNSVAYEINIYNGHTIGAAVGTNGAIQYGATGPVNVGSGHPIVVTLSYNASTHTLLTTLTDSITGASYTPVPTPLNIAQTIGANTAILGFTGGDGGVSSTQTVSNFLFLSGVGLVGNNFAETTGGGVSVNGGSLSATGLEVYANQVTSTATSGGTLAGTGGGISLAGSGQFSLNLTTISQNAAAQGGGLASSTSYTVSNSLVAGNLASTNGGGVADLGGSLTGAALLVYSNRVAASGGSPAGAGGGIYQSGGSLKLFYGSGLNGNSAASGGGLAVSYTGRTRLFVAQVANNAATTSGAGIQFGASNTQALSLTTVNVLSNHLSGSSLTGGGGGLYLSGGSMSASGLSVLGNTVTSPTSQSSPSNQTIEGGGIHANGTTLNLTGNSSSISYNQLIGNGSGPGYGAGMALNSGASVNGNAAVYVQNNAITSVTFGVGGGAAFFANTQNNGTGTPYFLNNSTPSGGFDYAFTVSNYATDNSTTGSTGPSGINYFTSGTGTLRAAVSYADTFMSGNSNNHSMAIMLTQSGSAFNTSPNTNYLLNTGQPINAAVPSDAELTIIGINGKAGIQGWYNRVFTLTGGSGTMVLQNMTVMGGYAVNGSSGTNGVGGGIYMTAGTLTLNNAQLSNNSAGYTGTAPAGANYGGTANGHAANGANGAAGSSGYGGGIYLGGGTLNILSNCSITGNTVYGQNGGAGGAGANGSVSAKQSACDSPYDTNRVNGGNGGNGGTGGVAMGGGIYQNGGTLNSQSGGSIIQNNFSYPGTGGNGGNAGGGGSWHAGCGSYTRTSQSGSAGYGGGSTNQTGAKASGTPNFDNANAGTILSDSSVPSTLSTAGLYQSGGTLSAASTNAAAKTGPPVAGIQLALFSADGTLLATTTSDAAGHFRFNSTYSGMGYVKLELPPIFAASARGHRPNPDPTSMRSGLVRFIDGVAVNHELVFGLHKAHLAVQATPGGFRVVQKETGAVVFAQKLNGAQYRGGFTVQTSDLDGDGTTDYLMVARQGPERLFVVDGRTFATKAVQGTLPPSLLWGMQVRHVHLAGGSDAQYLLMPISGLAGRITAVDLHQNIVMWSTPTFASGRIAVTYVGTGDPARPNDVNLYVQSLAHPSMHKVINGATGAYISDAYGTSLLGCPSCGRTTVGAHHATSAASASNAVVQDQGVVKKTNPHVSLQAHDAALAALTGQRLRALRRGRPA